MATAQHLGSISNCPRAGVTWTIKTCAPGFPENRWQEQAEAHCPTAGWARGEPLSFTMKKGVQQCKPLLTPGLTEPS